MKIRSARGRGAELAEARGLVGLRDGTNGLLLQNRDLQLEQSEQLSRIEALLERIAAATEYTAHAAHTAALAQQQPGH